MKTSPLKRLCCAVCLAALVIVVAACGPKAAPQGAAKKSPVHSCWNMAEWAEWDALVAKYPKDQDVIMLYAFRVGLCAMIERGQVEPNEAIGLFDRAHQAVIDGARAADAKRARGKPL